MNNLDIISGEAAVRSKRADYRSIFDAQADIRPDTLKQFMADPILVKQAITAVKKIGFGVSFTGKFSIGIFGSVDMFNRAFNITLAVDPVSGIMTVVNSPTIGYIDTTKNEQLKDLLAGIAFAPPIEFSGLPEDPPTKEKTWQLYPHEIPGKLGMKLIGKWVNNVKTIFIDSGFYYTHPYFSNPKWRLLDLAKQKPTVERLVKQAQAQFDMENKLLLQNKEVLEVAQAEKDSPQKASNIKKIEEENQEAEATIQSLTKYLDSPDDYDVSGHGTAVISNFLPIIPNTHIIIIKNIKGVQIDYFSFLQYAISLASKEENTMISLSSGPSITRNNRNNPPFINLFLRYFAEAEKNNILIVAASGNLNDKEEVPAWNQLEYPVVVGGAYFDQSKELTASNIANGYTEGGRSVPDVCGLSDNLIVPTPPTQKSPKGSWAVVDGTSYAAPQIAAVCALIKTSCPPASARDIKEMLIRTATPVVKGVTVQKILLTSIIHKFPDKDLPTGLVNIDKVLRVAARYNLNKLKGANATVKDAVAQTE